MRAIEPSETGTLKIAGFQVGYETFGDPANPTVCFLPTWQIVHSRIWKMQVPFFSRFRHVVTIDIPGNGDAERTTDPAAFEHDRIIDYGIGVLDHLQVDQADLVGLSMGGAFALWTAARYPERVRSLVAIGTALPEDTCSESPEFWQLRESYDGWDRFNANYWRRDFDGWLKFFFGNLCSEPHSTKQFDDLMSWGRQTTPEILITSTKNESLKPALSLEQVLERIRCPVFLIHGTDDRIRPVETSRELAQRRPDFTYLEMPGSGHGPTIRDPVQVNLAIAEFIGGRRPRIRTWRRAPSRRPARVLMCSSPIGLGHVHRDLAIAGKLRELIPGVEIDWLTTHPVTPVLERAGERVHPLSSEMANKSAHWESVGTEHELHCFKAFREMDEIMTANFMVFLDAVRETPYDLWIGDEAWEVDHFLHENPELKTSPYVFMTDFIGFLPMDRSPDSREAFLTADYNAEMIERIDRFPWVRDRSIFFGDFDDIVRDRFGPNLPPIRDWAQDHFIATGYPLTFDPEDYADKGLLRKRLGYDVDAPLVVAAIGGTATGVHLLRKVIAAWPDVLLELPDAQLVVVAGPRLKPEVLGAYKQVSVLPYVDQLHRHFAAANLGVVQGGLTTTMELAATRTPFLYFPLKNHFEQVLHVAHRLERYRAGVRLDYHSISPREIAQAIVQNIGSDTSAYRVVERGGVCRAAEAIASLLIRGGNSAAFSAEKGDILEQYPRRLRHQ
jgi:pimeloyl-ACP methyl ester carboxylesterase/predicted glycosyltransferase